MYEKEEKQKISFSSSLPLLLILVAALTIAILLLSTVTSSPNAVLNFSNQNIVLAFPPNNTSNHKPRAENMNVTTFQYSPVAFVLKGTDEDKADKLNFTVVAKPALGNITSFDTSSGAGVYTPTGNWIYVLGRDGFAYRVTDDKGGISNAASVTIISIEK